MLKINFTILFFLVYFFTLAQTDEIFDFEKNNKLDSIWWVTKYDKKNYNVIIDSETSFNGNNSLKISSKGTLKKNVIFGYTLPSICSGNKIKISGYIKSSNLVGQAGLWISVNPNLGYKNSLIEPVSSLQDWTRYEIEINFDSDEYEEITFGGVMVGDGEVWFDRFDVTINGDKWEKCARKKVFPANLDKRYIKGSGLTKNDFLDYKLDNLVLLGKLWGFLKYNHPEVRKGKYNWDYELFNILPHYLKIRNERKRDLFLLNWIKDLSSEKPTYTKKYKPLPEDLEWIQKEISTQRLSKELIKIASIKRSQENYYLDGVENIGNPKFTNENSYSKNHFPDIGFRLLALYKIWTVINYYYPYKNLISNDWSEILSHYLDDILKNKNELDYELTMLKFLAEIEDTHGSIYGNIDKIREWKGFNYSRIKLKFIDNELIVYDNYETRNNDTIGALDIGSIIKKINGKNIDEIIDQKREYYPASNKKTLLRDIAFDILRSNNNKIHLEYINQDKKKKSDSISLFRPFDILFTEKKDDKSSFYLIEDNIGYVDIGLITYEDMDKIIVDYKDLQGIIIDLRKYPSAFAPFKLGSFMIKSKKAFAQPTHFDKEKPGKFNYGNKVYLEPHENNLFFNGKLVILIDENTQSQGEYTLMAFQQNDNTTIIGSSNTAGANGDVSHIKLPGGLIAKFTGNGIYYPDGSTTQKKGIEPDIKINTTIDHIINGNDPLVEKALEIIMKDN